MSEIAYFDANACFGRSVCRIPGAPYDLPGLLSELDLCRISRALTFHAGAKELDSRRANASLLEEIKGEKRLVPAAVINPAPYTPDRDLAAETEELFGLGFRAFRLFPLYHGIDFNDPRMCEVLNTLARRKSALWLDFDQLWYNFKQLGTHEQRAVDLAAVEKLATGYPDLTVVLVGAYYNHFTRLFSLFDHCPNLKVETSLFQGFQTIRFVCERWGAERLLFGTGLGQVSPGAARATLAYAEISPEDKRKIASGNLESLLEEPPTSALAEDAERSLIMQDVDQGRPLERIRIYDAHGHITPPGFDGQMGLTLGAQDAESMVRVHDRIGIKSLVVSSWQVAGGDALRGNRTAWEAAERFPGRFLPLAVVNPNYPEDWPRIVTECFEKRRFFGLKPYPQTQRTALSKPAFKSMLELADRLSLPILCHFGFDPLAGVTPEEIEKLAPRYSNASFIIAHAGASYRVAAEVIPLAVEFDNVYLEINYTSVPYGMISHLVRNAPTEKVLFGTDTPMRDPAPIVGWVVYDHISDEEREKVLGGNFRRLLEKINYQFSPPVIRNMKKHFKGPLKKSQKKG